MLISSLSHIAPLLSFNFTDIKLISVNVFYAI